MDVGILAGNYLVAFSLMWVVKAAHDASTEYINNVRILPNQSDGTGGSLLGVFLLCGCIVVLSLRSDHPLIFTGIRIVHPNHT